MSLEAASGKLEYILKNLLLHWEETKARWNDPVARAFEEDHLGPLEQQVQSTRRAVDRLALTLNQAYRECRE